MGVRAKQSSPSPSLSPSLSSDGLVAFFVVACAWTWLLAVPAALAWMHHAAPSPAAMSCAGLSAFGPLLAALVMAAPRRQLGAVFGRWKTNPLWIVAALFTPMAIHLVAGVVATIAGSP